MNGKTFLMRSRKGPSAPEVPTGVELQTGPPPNRIGRRFIGNNMGMNTSDQISSQAFNDEMYVPHRAIVRTKKVKATRSGIPAFDETAYIPAFAVGDPR